MADVEESFAYCRAVARARARNFYYSFLLFPAEKRKAMCALYAFMRYCDDISDGSGTASGRGRLLDEWKGALERSLRMEKLDVTLPGRPISRGRLHLPKTLVGVVDIGLF